MKAKTYFEELLWIESEDGIRLDGVVIRPAMEPKPIAVVHIPGWDVSFCHPIHLLVGRALASRGYLCVIGNNRGSAFGEIAQRRGDFVAIGAGWERFHECPLDIGPWLEFAISLGFQSAVLLGHSFGGAKVVFFQAQRQDPRVAGLVCASPGPIGFPTIESEVIAEAERLVAQGRGTELLPWGSYGNGMTLSAQTLLDWAPGNHATLNIFGTATQEPALARIRCPILAFYGTKHDIGTADDLDRIRHTASASLRVDTHLFEDADHSYTAHEREVGSAIAVWLDALVTTSLAKA